MVVTIMAILWIAVNLSTGSSLIATIVAFCAIPVIEKSLDNKAA